MGHKRHSYKEMKTAREAREREYGDAFAYDRTVRSTGIREIHASVNPAHGGVRHIAEGELLSVCFDVTGSYRSVPREVQADLPELFTRLVLNKWIPGKLNLQFGAIGDVYSDTAPIQLSQAEPDGATADEWLSKLYLEGGGGGGNHESYELMMWALANQNRFSGWNSGKKGNAFIIFDEMTYPHVDPAALRDIYSRKSNHTLTDDGAQLSPRMMRDSLDSGEDSVVLPDNAITTEEMAAQLREKYDVWGIMIQGTAYWSYESNVDYWKGLLGEQNIVRLEDAGNISELISGLMGAKYAAVSAGAIMTTLKDAVQGNRDMGVIEGAMGRVAALPSPVTFNVDPGKMLTGAVSDSGIVGTSGSDGVDRL